LIIETRIIIRNKIRSVRSGGVVVGAQLVAVGNSGAMRTFSRRRFETVQKPKKPQGKNKNGGEGAKNTLLSLRYNHRHMFVSARLRQLARARDTAMRGRAPRASRGRRQRPLASVARVNAFSHRSWCSSVCARSSRRVPSVLLRTDDYYTTVALLVLRLRAK